MIKEMDIVKQRNDWDCGYCCFAMWANLSYEIVIENAKTIGLGVEGLNGDEMIQLGDTFDMDIFHLPLFNDDLTGIITVPSKNQLNGHHAVFYKDRTLYDPQFCLPDMHWYFPNAGKDVFKKYTTIDLGDEYSHDIAMIYMSEQNEIWDNFNRGWEQI